MRVVILYHPKTEQEPVVADYVHEYQTRYGDAPELISLETVAGAEMAKLYGVTNYPAVLALSESGQLQSLWQAELLPLMSDVEYYRQQP